MCRGGGSIEVGTVAAQAALAVLRAGVRILPILYRISSHLRPCPTSEATSKTFRAPLLEVMEAQAVTTRRQRLWLLLFGLRIALLQKKENPNRKLKGPDPA